LNPPQQRPGVPVVKTVAQLGLGIALVAGLVAWVSPDWDEVAGTVRLSAPWLLVSLSGSLLATIVTAGRWKLLSEAMGAGRLPYGVYFHWLALTRVVGQFMPTVVVDLLGRTAALRAAGSRSGMGHLMTTVVTERLFDLLLPLFMLAWAMSVQTELVAVSPYVTLAVATLVFSLAAVPLLSPAARLALAVYARLRRIRHPSPTEGPAPLSMGRTLAAQIVALSLLRYAGILVQYLGAGAGFGVVLAPLVLLSAAPAAQAAGIIGITPGGLGMQEGGWTAVLSTLGEQRASIVVFMAGARIMMVVNFGLLALASWPWRTAGSPPESTDPAADAPNR